MKILKTILLVTNSMITFVMTAFLVLAGSYSLYALWDNSQVYAAADNVQAELLKLKPEEKADNFERSIQMSVDGSRWIIPMLICRCCREKTILLISIQMYMGNLLWQGVFFWTPAVTVLSDRSILFFMVTIWRIIRCSEIWICIKKKIFSTKTEQVLCICRKNRYILRFLPVSLFLLQKKIFLHRRSGKQKQREW